MYDWPAIFHRRQLVNNTALQWMNDDDFFPLWLVGLNIALYKYIKRVYVHVHLYTNIDNIMCIYFVYKIVPYTAVITRARFAETEFARVKFQNINERIIYKREV